VRWSRARPSWESRTLVALRMFRARRCSTRRCGRVLGRSHAVGRATNNPAIGVSSLLGEGCAWPAWKSLFSRFRGRPPAALTTRHQRRDNRRCGCLLHWPWDECEEAPPRACTSGGAGLVHRRWIVLTLLGPVQSSTATVHSHGASRPNSHHERRGEPAQSDASCKAQRQTLAQRADDAAVGRRPHPDARKTVGSIEEALAG
jgi:hypothetical protein